MDRSGAPKSLCFSGFTFTLLSTRGHALVSTWSPDIWTRACWHYLPCTTLREGCVGSAIFHCGSIWAAAATALLTSCEGRFSFSLIFNLLNDSYFSNIIVIIIIAIIIPLLGFFRHDSFMLVRGFLCCILKGRWVLWFIFVRVWSSLGSQFGKFTSTVKFLTKRHHATILSLIYLF